MPVISVVSTSNRSKSRPYPKLVKSPLGNVYYMFSQKDGVIVHKIALAHMPPVDLFHRFNGTMNCELPGWVDFEGSVSLAND